MTAHRRFSPLRWRLSPNSRLTRDGRARRRYNCVKQGEWGERAEAAVALVAEHLADRERVGSDPVRIADFGAGNERLRLLLQAGLQGTLDYRSYDLHPQLPTTTRLDVAREMPDADFDVVFCLGLLEYLPSIPDLARRLRTVCRFALVSYVTSDSAVAIPHEERLRHGWTTHLTAKEIETAFDRAGFRLAGSTTSDGEATTLWLWTNLAAERSP
jgi:hypothetical protein